MQNLIPEGFVKGGHSAYSNHIGPFYYQKNYSDAGFEDGWVGLVLEDVHIGSNNRGHGGLLMTVLDEAMGMSAALTRDRTPVVTISLQTNFFAPLLPGHFLKATATVTKTTGSMAFVDGKAWCGDTLVGSASGVWKYLTGKKA